MFHQPDVRRGIGLRKPAFFFLPGFLVRHADFGHPCPSGRSYLTLICFLHQAELFNLSDRVQVHLSDGDIELWQQPTCVQSPNLEHKSWCGSDGEPYQSSPAVGTCWQIKRDLLHFIVHLFSGLMSETVKSLIFFLQQLFGVSTVGQSYVAVTLKLWYCCL